MIRFLQGLETCRWFSPGTPISSTNKTESRNNWNTVESGFKHHNPNPNPFSFILHEYFVVLIAHVNKSFI